MNLCGEFITHKVFGRGQIVEISDNCVMVLFETVKEQKKFIYPSSIGTFLLLDNKKLAKQMQEYKTKITQAEDMEQKLAEDKRQAERLATQKLTKHPRKPAKKKLAAKSPPKSK
ncbi:MAG: hypothetical protein VB055_10415 [Oscillospiraceae bacterium]|nr:hypothetical protein [Oscillospiraceae bacterium]